MATWPFNRIANPRNTEAKAGVGISCRRTPQIVTAPCTNTLTDSAVSLSGFIDIVIEL